MKSGKYIPLDERINMLSTKVNADYRITIPKEIRGQLNLKPGQKVRLEASNRVVKLIPLKEEEER